MTDRLAEIRKRCQDTKMELPREAWENYRNDIEYLVARLKAAEKVVDAVRESVARWDGKHWHIPSQEASKAVAAAMNAYNVSRLQTRKEN